MNKEIRNYLKRIGSKGGNVRASRYSKATLRKWAKKGGRPRKKRTAERSEGVS